MTQDERSIEIFNGCILKIRIMNIPEDEMNLQFSRDGDWFHNSLPEREKANFSLQRIDAFLSIKRLQETVSIVGNIEAIVDAECCRCLEVTSHSLKSEFRYTLVPTADKDREELELGPEDSEFGYYQDDTVDLDQIIFEQIVLQIPIKVLCKDSCKGLCPHCGINLNMASCNCHADFVDERLTVLKKVKI